QLNTCIEKYEYKQDMNLNALQMVFAVLTAQYTFDISAGRRIWPLNIIRNYTCQYGHYSIPDKICLDVSYPCVSLCCSAGSSELVISGCPLPTDFNNSTLDGYKYWPNCCSERNARLCESSSNTKGLDLSGVSTQGNKTKKKHCVWQL
ncbi:hypothetical protein MTO96_036024, partial [Rhipicephalus appendiculatus]